MPSNQQKVAHQQIPGLRSETEQRELSQPKAPAPPQPVIWFKLCGSLEAIQIVHPQEWWQDRLNDQDADEIMSMEVYILRRLAMNVDTTIATFHFGNESCDYQRPFSDLYEVYDVRELVGNPICLHTRRVKKRPAPAEGDSAVLKKMKARAKVDAVGKPSIAVAVPRTSKVRAEQEIRGGKTNRSAAAPAVQGQAQSDGRRSTRSRNARKK